ncbi:hypothetical protein ABH935_006433 [Catenulispora sp. GAS73]|uniref:hypothetical protein n=1 Tax=Catenulispora sp. GAS73 TaxID=3156269 RepID=UPI003514AAD3
MTDELPLVGAQLGFALMAERSGRRTAIYGLYRIAPSLLPAADLNVILQSIVHRNPTLSHRIRFRRGVGYQERYQAAHEFAELGAENEDESLRRIMEEVAAFEGAPDGASMVVRLVRSPHADYLLLICEHALVDGQGFDLIKKQLAAPAPPREGEWDRFEAAVYEQAEFEAAAEKRGVGFWTERLSAFPEGLRKGALRGDPQGVRYVLAPSVAIPSVFRGSCFPLVLFSLHRAVRDVAGVEPTVIAYPWGRPRKAPSAVCFLNTVISLDLTGPRDISEAVGDFLDGWYSEIDCADVPFQSVAAIKPAVSGSIAGLLTYQVASGDSTVNIAGIPAVEISPTYGRSQSMAPFTVAAVVRGKQVELTLVVDEEITGYSGERLGARWHHRLGEVLSCFADGEQGAVRSSESSESGRLKA